MKSKHYSFLLGLFILALSFQPLNAQLIVNGDFESWTAGVPDGWTTIEEGITVTEENTTIRGGAAAAAINVITGNQGSTDFRQSIPIEAGKIYKVSVWVYHTEGGVRARLYSSSFQNYSEPSITGQWQELSTVYTASAAGDLEFGLRFYDTNSFDGEEIVYVDDYTVSEIVDPTITITSPTGSTDLQTGDFNMAFDIQNFVVGTPGTSGVDGSIIYSVDGSELDHFSTDPIAISGLADGMHELSVTLKDNDGMLLSGDGGDTIMVNVVSPMITEVSDVASLRAGVEGDYYRLTGEVFLTYQQVFRNQKFVQDATGGILIDDTNDLMNSPYEVNDGITGITGELSSFGGMLQFIPIGSAGPATSSGNMITPTVVTTADLTNNFEDYESELVMVMDATFVDGGDNFSNSAVYGITDAMGSYNFRTTFFNVDYINSVIPAMANITGIPNSRDDGEYFTARNIADIDGVMPPMVTEVATIAELRAGVEGELYRLTGEALLTYQQSFRNQKHIQDATGGILIDDQPGNLSTTYAINDGITGITGTLGSFGGMMQFAPNADAGAPTSTGNTIPTQLITLDDLINNFEDHESEVVTINDITFDNPGDTFENGTVYGINDPASSYQFRTTFFSVDYIGSPIPSDMVNVTGIPNSREVDGTITGFFSARNLADFDGVPPPAFTDVATIAELRAGVEGELYRLTGEALLTYQQSFRNQKHIQDATGGILIDDQPGNLSTTYAINDGITGITGTLGSFGGMMQFAPNADAGAPTSTGNTIPTQLITLDDLINNFEDHESEVVTINDITFDNPGDTFENGTVYGINDPASSYQFRTTFFSVDYIGSPIPSGMVNVTGIPNSRDVDGMITGFFSARDLADFDGVPPPSITDVATIAELRAGVEGELYRLTGEAILTYQQSFRNQKYLQDATAGILIDDSPGTLSTTYAVNDGITNLVGRLGSFGGMTQFAPFSDAGPATSSNNTIPEQIVTLAELTSDFEDHEGEVMTVQDVTFADAGMIFVNGTVYGISDPSGSYNFRTTFFDVDYIDGEIPGTINVRGIPNSRNDGDYFTARNLADFDIFISTEDLTQTNFSIFPNPNNGVFTIVNEGITGMYTFEFTNLLGQNIYRTQQQLTDGQRTEINSKIQTPGMYFVKMSNPANNFIRTLPLIIK